MHAAPPDVGKVVTAKLAGANEPPRWALQGAQTNQGKQMAVVRERYAAARDLSIRARKARPNENADSSLPLQAAHTGASAPFGDTTAGEPAQSPATRTRTIER